MPSLALMVQMEFTYVLCIIHSFMTDWWVGCCFFFLILPWDYTAFHLLKSGLKIHDILAQARVGFSGFPRVQLPRTGLLFGTPHSQGCSGFTTPCYVSHEESRTRWGFLWEPQVCCIKSSLNQRCFLLWLWFPWTVVFWEHLAFWNIPTYL